MKWSEEIWDECTSVYDQILKLPFLNELMKGTLLQDNFRFYLQQDALYLAEYGRVLAGIAVQLDRKEWREDFLKFSADTVAVEQALHQYYLKEDRVDVDPTPTCMLYTGYLYRQLASASVEEAMAAILPCFWVYKKVGDHILENQVKNNNPFQSWIDTYGGEEFALAVEKAIGICDEVAQNTTPACRELMNRSFRWSFKLEWMFWDSAWKMEEWAV